MMKLILSLTLIWMLSSTVGALQCQDQTGSISNCKSDEYCAAAAIKGSSERQSKSCVSSSLCNPSSQTFSCNFGFYNLTAFVRCCNTTDCSSQIVSISDPDAQTKNKLQCFTCDDGQSAVCNKIVQCFGVEDRCSSGSVAAGNNITKFFGCASRNLCEAASKLKDLRFLDDRLNFTSAPKCCETNFCNSAWTVKLSVVPLLLGLIALIVY